MLGVGGCVIVVILTAITVVFGIMLKTVDYDEWGVAHVNNVLQNEKKIYEPGRYNMGFREDFKLFKSTIHFLSFGGDGCSGHYGTPCVKKTQLLLIPKGNPNPIPTQAILQFRLRKDGLVTLYQKYKMNYVNKFEKVIRQQLKYVAQKYQVEDYYYSRETVVAAMAASINTTLAEIGIDMLGFQVIRFTLPAAQDTRMQSVVLRQYQVKVGQQQGEVNKAKAFSERQLLEYSAKTETYQISMEQKLNLKLAGLKANETLILTETKRKTDEIRYQNATAKNIYQKETQNMMQKVKVNTSTAKEETDVQRKIIKAVNDTSRRSYEQTTNMLNVTILANLTRAQERGKQDVAKIKNSQAKWETLYHQETEIMRQDVKRQEEKIRAETARLLAEVHIQITGKRSENEAAMQAVSSHAQAQAVQLQQAARARGVQMKANVSREVYQEMVKDLGFSGRDLLLLQYVESMRVSLANKARKGAEIYMDIKTPQLFKDAESKMVQI